MTIRYPTSETDPSGTQVETDNADLSNPVSVRLPQATDPCQADVINAPAKQLRDRMALVEERMSHAVMDDGVAKTNSEDVNIHAEFHADKVVARNGLISGELSPLSTIGDLTLKSGRNSINSAVRVQAPVFMTDVGRNILGGDVVLTEGDIEVNDGDIYASGEVSATTVTSQTVTVGAIKKRGDAVHIDSVAVHGASSFHGQATVYGRMAPQALTSQEGALALPAVVPLRVMSLYSSDGTTWSLSVGGVSRFAGKSSSDAGVELSSLVGEMGGGSLIFIGGECRSSSPQNAKTLLFGGDATSNASYLSNANGATGSNAMTFVGFAI